MSNKPHYAGCSCILCQREAHIHDEANRLADAMNDALDEFTESCLLDEGEAGHLQTLVTELVRLATGYADD